LFRINVQTKKYNLKIIGYHCKNRTRKKSVCVRELVIFFECVDFLYILLTLSNSFFGSLSFCRRWMNCWQVKIAFLLH
jgi:hypothetical protein